MDAVKTCLWYDGRAEEAARFYASVLDDVEIGDVMRNLDGSVLTIECAIQGQRYLGLNGGPQYRFTEAASIMVSCTDQAEADRYWSALTADGRESQCGWLVDRYGLSWQIVPAGLHELLADPDPARAHRALQAMLGMTRLDIAAMAAAADGTPS